MEKAFDLADLVYVFLLVVVAAKLLYTTTTSGLWGTLCFGVGVYFGLQDGCAIFH